MASGRSDGFAPKNGKNNSKNSKNSGSRGGVQAGRIAKGAPAGMGSDAKKINEGVKNTVNKDPERFKGKYRVDVVHDKDFDDYDIIVKHSNHLSQSQKSEIDRNIRRNTATRYFYERDNDL